MLAKDSPQNHKRSGVPMCNGAFLNDFIGRLLSRSCKWGRYAGALEYIVCHRTYTQSTLLPPLSSEVCSLGVLGFTSDSLGDGLRSTTNHIQMISLVAQSRSIPAWDLPYQVDSLDQHDRSRCATNTFSLTFLVTNPKLVGVSR